MRKSCHRCLGPGYRLFDTIERVISVVEKSQNGSGKMTCCLATDKLDTKNAVGEREQNDDGQRSRHLGVVPYFHMTGSADLLRDLHASEGYVTIANDTIIGAEGYGSLTVIV